MAGTHRTTTHDLIDELAQHTDRFDFFQAMRLLECEHRDKPRLGTSLKACDDAVRLSQPPELAFPAGMLQAFTPNGEFPPRLAVNFFGLFGSHGALPLHLTEYARERLRHHHDPTFARFADIFHHRMLCLFYRAWANVRPTLHYDRPESDRFADYVGSLFGIGTPAYDRRDALADEAKLFYVGYFAAQTKSPCGLQAIIADLLAVKVHIDEFVGEWMAVQPEDYTRLGHSPQVATLGQSAFLGARVWGCQHKFRIVLAGLSWMQYCALLPNGSVLPKLIAMVRNYVGDELVWDVNLVLKKDDVPQAQLNGEFALGWTTWLGERRSGRDADDLRLAPVLGWGFV